MTTTNMRGHLLRYGWVWFCPGGIANILSMSMAREKYRATFDRAMDNCFHVHKYDGKPYGLKRPVEGYIILTL